MEWKNLFNNIQGQSQARAHAAKVLAYLTVQVIFPNHGIRDSTNLNEHSHEYLQHREDRVVPIITQENPRDKIHINRQRFFRVVAESGEEQASRIWHALPDEVIRQHTYYASRVSSCLGIGS